MKVAICDDMPELAQHTENLMLKYNSKLFDTDIFYDPERLLERCETEHYDLFFLDIEMPSLTGIELAEKLRGLDIQAPIIFLTSYKQYMEDVFRLHTFDYLLKPISEEKMFTLLDRLLKYLNINEDRFSFTFNKVTKSIPLSDIIYFEKMKRNVIIHTDEEEFSAVLTTENLLEQLNNHFVQVHKSFIINAQKATEVSKETIILKGKSSENFTVPMGRKYTKDAKEKILMEMREVM